MHVFLLTWHTQCSSTWHTQCSSTKSGLKFVLNSGTSQLLSCWGVKTIWWWGRLNVNTTYPSQLICLQTTQITMHNCNINCTLIPYSRSCMHSWLATARAKTLDKFYIMIDLIWHLLSALTLQFTMQAGDLRQTKTLFPLEYFLMWKKNCVTLVIAWRDSAYNRYPSKFSNTKSRLCHEQPHCNSAVHFFIFYNLFIYVSVQRKMVNAQIDRLLCHKRMDLKSGQKYDLERNRGDCVRR